MTTETLSKEQEQLVRHFEAKLSAETGPVELKYMIDAKKPVQIVDLRTPDLYERAHIPGAINIQYEDLEDNLGELDKDKTIVVYCYDIVCHLSARAALLLARKGYRVQELFGAFAEWKKHEMPVEGTESRSAPQGAPLC